MKKFLAFIVVLLMAAGAFIQFAVPKALTNYLKNKVVEMTSAQEVTLTLDSLPSAKIAFGYIDSLHCTADDATIGELNLKKVQLDGSTIHIDVKELLLPTDGLSRDERTERVLKHASRLELSGVITEDALKNFLIQKIGDQLRSPQVSMTPEGISVEGKVKILGREADVQIGGQIIARDGDLYFQMNHINLENAILRRVNLDKFLGDFNITERVKLPFDMQFRTVEMHQGEAFVTATKSN